MIKSTLFIFMVIMLLSATCHAFNTQEHSDDTPWQIFEHTIRGKNELCPSVARGYVAKTFHTKNKMGFDTRTEISYEGWVRNITQENKVMFSVGLEF